MCARHESFRPQMERRVLSHLTTRALNIMAVSQSQSRTVRPNFREQAFSWKDELLQVHMEGHDFFSLRTKKIDGWSDTWSSFMEYSRIANTLAHKLLAKRWTSMPWIFLIMCWSEFVCSQSSYLHFTTCIQRKRDKTVLSPFLATFIFSYKSNNKINCKATINGLLAFKWENCVTSLGMPEKILVHVNSFYFKAFCTTRWASRGRRPSSSVLSVWGRSSSQGSPSCLTAGGLQTFSFFFKTCLFLAH